MQGDRPDIASELLSALGEASKGSANLRLLLAATVSPALRLAIDEAVAEDERLAKREAAYDSAYGPYLHDAVYADGSWQWGAYELYRDESWPTLASTAKPTLRPRPRVIPTTVRLKPTSGRTSTRSQRASRTRLFASRARQISERLTRFKRT